MGHERIVSEIFSSIRRDGRSELTEYESKQVLSAWDVPTVETYLSTDKPEAVEMAAKVGYPVVMKIASPDIIHKSDVGGVKTGLSSDADVRDAFDEVMLNARNYRPDADILGVTVQEQFTQGHEVIIGSFQDATFGATVMFGLGGIWVEILEDVSFRITPVSPKDAREMIEEIGGYPILKGVRGGFSADIGMLAEIIQKISDLSVKFNEISEMDLNPVFAFDRGAFVADARIILSRPR